MAQANAHHSTAAVGDHARIEFGRVGTRAWLAAVDAYNEAKASLAEFEMGEGAVTFLRPAAELQRRTSALTKAAFGLIEHSDRHPRTEPGIVRLTAVLLGHPDPAWLDPHHAETAGAAVMLASYKTALRRAA